MDRARGWENDFNLCLTSTRTFTSMPEFGYCCSPCHCVCAYLLRRAYNMNFIHLKHVSTYIFRWNFQFVRVAWHSELFLFFTAFVFLLENFSAPKTMGKQFLFLLLTKNDDTSTRISLNLLLQLPLLFCKEPNFSLAWHQHTFFGMRKILFRISENGLDWLLISKSEEKWKRIHANFYVCFWFSLFPRNPRRSHITVLVFKFSVSRNCYVCLEWKKSKYFH